MTQINDRSTTPEPNSALPEEEPLSGIRSIIVMIIPAPPPVEESKSLAAFFRDLGITNLVIGDPAGRYGSDWGHVRSEDIDRAVRVNSIFAHSIPIMRTTIDPRTVDYNLAPVDPAIFGAMELPSYTATDWSTYTFTAVAFRNDEFVLSTEIFSAGSDEVAHDFTVTELRQMIGETMKAGEAVF